MHFIYLYTFSGRLIPDFTSHGLASGSKALLTTYAVVCAHQKVIDGQQARQCNLFMSSRTRAISEHVLRASSMRAPIIAGKADPLQLGNGFWEAVLGSQLCRI